MPVTSLRGSDPERVGPHRLLGRLGQGGMGTVYLGVDHDGRAVAVKVLRDGPTDPEARRRFQHELAALRRVRGPHLVEVLDSDVDADLPYLVTRFVPGQRLDEVVQRSGPLPLRSLLRLARGLADALTTLHSAGVVHRDLTPGNVLLVDGEPHLIDLGLATASDVTALTRTGLIVGTPGYLAPEQVLGNVVTPAVDIHAWGATLALAATGRPPFGSGRPEAVLYRIVHDRPDLAGLPPELAPMVREAMSPDPDDRPLAPVLLRRLGGRPAIEPAAPTVRLPRDLDVTTVLASTDLTRRASAAPALAQSDLAPRHAPARTLVAAGPHRADEPPHGGHEGWDDPRWQPAFAGGLVPYEPEPAADTPRVRPARTLQLLLTTAAATAVVVAGTLVAPVLGAAVVLLVLTVLRAAGRSSARLRDRRERRGDRRRDPVVTTLAAPWSLLLGLVQTVLSLPLLLAVAALPAGVVWLVDPVVPGLERPELTAATAVGTVLLAGLSRRTHLPSRRLLRRSLVRLTPGPVAALVVLVGLVLAGGLLLATAEGQAAVWLPLRGAVR